MEKVKLAAGDVEPKRLTDNFWHNIHNPYMGTQPFKDVWTVHRIVSYAAEEVCEADLKDAVLEHPWKRRS